MKLLIVALLGLSLVSCSKFKEDGVAQCESTIFAKLEDPSFYRRVSTEVANINVPHPNVNRDFTQRWIDIVYDVRGQGGASARHRHHCVFNLKNGTVGDMVSEQDLAAGS